LPTVSGSEVPQDFAWVNGSHPVRRHALSTVVVDDIDVSRTVGPPTKADSKLVIASDAVSSTPRHRAPHPTATPAPYGRCLRTVVKHLDEPGNAPTRRACPPYLRAKFISRRAFLAEPVAGTKKLCTITNCDRSAYFRRIQCGETRQEFVRFASVLDDGSITCSSARRD
jgi:hypothetical protein